MRLSNINFTQPLCVKPSSFLLMLRVKFSKSPRMAARWMLLSLLFWLSTGFAVADLYPFESADEHAQFSRLTQEVRCLVCQNQSIADSNAGFAEDLRAEVYRLVRQHQTDQGIKAHLQHRYGAYVLFNPPLSRYTWVLWLAPIVLLLLGFAGVFWVVYRQSVGKI